MANKTDYKRTLSGSVGAGMKSIFSAGGRSYYILEHKVSSRYYKAGESQEIIVDQVELGRDSKCQVRFDENFKTVSRRHAAIIKDGDRWKLVHLSTVNKTLLNGQPVTKEWYLQNGDEIQLSVNGPKLGFIVPTGAKATVGSIGLSRRLSLFRQQALRPYKTAMWVMTILILLLLGGGITYAVLNEKGKDKIIADNKIIKEDNEALKKENVKLKEQLEELTKKVTTINDAFKKVNIKDKDSDVVPDGVKPPKELNICANDVFFLVMNIRLELDGVVKEGKIGTGTGFLLNDGRFVTARHCVHPWMFLSEDDEFGLYMNVVANNGGKMTCVLDAYSPDGKRIHFTSDQVSVNDMNDKTIKLDNGFIIKVAQLDCNDYAVVQTNEKGDLVVDGQLSKNLQITQELDILGYPMGLGAEKVGVQPYYSKATVARNGLAEGGYIPTTSSSFEHGNSGGPVFVKVDKGYKVVGIVSAGAGRSTGFIVPISQIH